MKENKTKIYCLITLTIVFIFFLKTIFYPLKLYDEIAVINGINLPIPDSFKEMFKYISLSGLQQHFEASNTLYSSISSIRCNPVGAFIQLFIQTLFQKNTVLYHLYSLVLHLINTLLVFFIINKTWQTLGKGQTQGLPLQIIFTLLWALHPANVESVLLLSNANIVLSYTFCFISFLIYLELKESIAKQILLFLSFLTALFIAEFHFIFPFILISFSICYTRSILTSLKNTFGLFLADIFYIIAFLSSKTVLNISTQGSIDLILERIFWLSPQVIFHYLKLIFFPYKLSIDQSHLVVFGKTLFDPYAIFCFLIVVFLIIFAIRSLVKAKECSPVFFIMFFPFFRFWL